MFLTFILAALVINCTCTADDEDLPTFFNDKMNVIALFGGLGIIAISTAISLYLCSVADKRRRK